MNLPVTIIIPNFNGARLIGRNLPSVLRAAEAYQPGTEVIVVDDGSGDDSVATLQQGFPQVRVVRHLANRGFADAIYSGVVAAGTELLFLLNSDVQPERDCLRLLSEYFVEPDTFAVCPLVRDESGEINRHSWNVRSYQHGNLKPVSWTLEDALRRRGRLPTMYASGGSMLVRRSMFLELGGFHPLFKPFYGEDYDLGLRAWRRGWQSYFEPNVSVVHQRRGSIKENVKRERVKRIRRRNKYLLEWMHLPAWRLWCCVIPLSLWQLLGELLLLDRVNIAGFLTALPRIPSVLAARRAIRKTQRRSMHQVMEIFDQLLQG